jgi:hypothetical protein
VTIGVGFVTSSRALRRVSDEKTVASKNLRHFSSILDSYKARRGVQSCMPHLIKLSRSWVDERVKKELPMIQTLRIILK